MAAIKPRREKEERQNETEAFRTLACHLISHNKISLSENISIPKIRRLKHTTIEKRGNQKEYDLAVSKGVFTQEFASKE